MFMGEMTESATDGEWTRFFPFGHIVKTLLRPDFAAPGTSEYH